MPPGTRSRRRKRAPETQKASKGVTVVVGVGPKVTVDCSGKVCRQRLESHLKKEVQMSNKMQASVLHKAVTSAAVTCTDGSPSFGFLKFSQVRHEGLRCDDRVASLCADGKQISVPANQKVGVAVSRKLQERQVPWVTA